MKIFCPTHQQFYLDSAGCNYCEPEEAATKEPAAPKYKPLPEIQFDAEGNAYMTLELEEPVNIDYDILIDIIKGY